MDLTLDNTLDYRVFSATFCLLAIAYLIIARKNFTAAAHSWALFAFDLGGERLLGVSFAILYSLISYYVIFELLVRNAKQRKTKKKRSRTLPLIIVLGIVLVKIVVDSFAYGFDIYRTQVLYASQFYLIIPLIILVLYFKLYGILKALKDFIISGTILFTLILLPLLPSIFLTQFIPSITEGHRITIFNIDTINSCRLFVYCALFAYCSYFFTKKRSIRLFLVGLMVLSIILIILNGTRQYLLAVIVAAVLANIRTLNLKQITFIVILAATGFYFYNTSETIQNIELVNRVSSNSIQKEESENRGLIWATNFKRMLDESPLIGLGFRNSGQEITMTDSETKQEVKAKDNAHGFFQEVFVEHGVILGLLLTITFINAFLVLRKKLQRYDTVTKKVIVSTCIIFILPLFFSGSVLNGFGIFYFALLASKLEGVAVSKKILKNDLNIKQLQTSG